jgi:hypothetical protein
MGLIDRLFLVKKIISREGLLHFRRWRLLATPWVSVYIHHIARSDEDKDPHNHPFAFRSLILKGGYSELVEWWDHPKENRQDTKIQTFRAGQSVYHPTSDYHKITLTNGKPAWTLVFTGKRNPGQWGYLVDGKHVDHVTYRKEKDCRAGFEKLVGHSNIESLEAWRKRRADAIADLDAWAALGRPDED